MDGFVLLKVSHAPFNVMPLSTVILEKLFQFVEARWGADFVKAFLHLKTGELVFAHEFAENVREIKRLVRGKTIECGGLEQA